MIIGVDVGGTFTDVVAIDGADVVVRKVPTSPDPSVAMHEVVGHLAPDRGADSLVHGTTVATNALLERTGARTVLVTDAGFEDLIEIGRQDRPALYDPEADRAPPLVDRDDRIGVSGSTAPDIGDAEAVAVSLVRGHRQAGREAAIADQIAERHDVPVSRSSVVAPEFREYERTSTTVLNAYLTPATGRYLTALEVSLASDGLARSVGVMRSSGGLMSLTEAAEYPAAILLSGPAGGVVAAGVVASAHGARSVVSFDMGGTSTDVCLIVDGEADVSYERSIAGYTCRMPAVGVHTVGAGGGSVAWIDPGGALRVGPQSAGSHPGPACYGRGGTEPTVTDANVVLGRLDPAMRLGGSLPIHPDLAHDAVARIAHRVGESTERVALGILAIAEETMAGAVRTVSVARGHDPGGSLLVAYGGAGGLHATAVARRLGMDGVLVPPGAGVLSAIGLVLSPPRSDAVRAVFIDDDDLADAHTAAAELQEQTRRSIVGSGATPDRTDLHLDVRYVGQAHEIAVPWAPHERIAIVRERFETLHRTRYGFIRNDDPLEIVSVRAATIGAAPLEALPADSDDVPVTPGRRAVIGRDGIERTATIVGRDTLLRSGGIEGPAVIEERDTTIYVDCDEHARVTPAGSVEVGW